jgi:MFS family permease
MPDSSVAVLPAHAVERAVKLSYMQAMLGSIYAASTGGMFLIGYALKLGADDIQIGLLTAVPMLCVVAQLFTSAIVERGTSRRTLTLAAALTNVLGWILIIMIPYAAAGLSATAQIGLLTAIVALGAFFAHVQGNARSSWVGDLVPAQMRGRFFGRITMFAGFIAMGFALAEGLFLDYVKNMGIAAFSVLFVFGMLFGLANASLFAPQADVPLQRQESRPTFLAMVKAAFTNRPLMMLMLFHLLWQVQMIAAPFYPTYMLRDMKMPFFGVGLINAAAQITVLATSPLWGRIVDRYGCRPVLVACTAALVPIPLIWIWMTTPLRIYMTVIPLNLVSGVIGAGVSVAITTLMYKATPSAGRSVQFAVYSLFVVLVPAPLPVIGGYLPTWVKALGWPLADLRVTFLVPIAFLVAAVLTAKRIGEPGSRRTRELVRHLPVHLLGGRVPA